TSGTGSTRASSVCSASPGRQAARSLLPVPEVVQHCSDLGFGVGEIFALCGPFSAEFNAAFYRQCRADVVVTKASG
ncbi:precorrin-6A/cobalt-precorrin-6A reductase, partial [Klebsiella pneumoniae]|uniref:precorrin-6A/cobalt-precorrin-6A reductase n=1 Tax=Klebsiella pneumoniae TaxID=573 RepID=UPI003A4C67DA